MTKTYFKLIFLFALSLFAVSCSNDDDTTPETPDEALTEFKYLRILLSDEKTTQLTLVNPVDATSSFFNAKFAKSSLYTTESGRYAGIVHRLDNTVETFDSGFESHGDHVDVDGQPQFGALTGQSALPTHFKSKIGEILTFNDGDGTLSVAKEKDVNTAGAQFKTINAGLLAHHGAMAAFGNGTYAITVKDNSVTGTLPEKVKIIDNTGKTLFEPTLATKGIHGNASDGTYAVFGSASGVLVVENNGKQKLIAFPEDFGTAWFGTILETDYNGKFVGFTAAKGAYLIDVVNGTIKPIIQNTTIMQCKVSYNHKKLGVLLHSGEFKLFNLNSLQVEKEAKIIGETANDAALKPQIQLTEHFAYITSPSTGELLQLSFEKMSIVNKIKVSNTPYMITILGFENSESH
ncbi:hypothetical protein [Flavobacterium johnsoniae]|uniref:Hypothetical lipoprotein n=1 Tax=Flavobacterium johnsoniae (strain ATCC 17061 / DSM 2064 / JCM 8514 / BCRC 14874 / CCUG 350202 / NBRC 14942 / NCIMB 11054 / UW101) TaxID=376686 RepID=A5FER3_FLAJ1|nr:hypothetical protein [Flavobacterium johnsoniae]ABQ06306.1 hypothetical lipoprotein [Flavobacterium johnsoniae UW101]OXE98224.1 hypothetical protein B0A63_14845 [Flavobacterium johnsoniae UW101]WQG82053.1 hypothetical protein SR927_02870 [Flavobacterium johnsoniae UW101]SHK71430.1 hypothetical protein SAMN05444146_2029 [Flavobacterium johnsoniae]